ncbi:MAG: hypothetical protein JXB00_02860 [Bacteroidales bacterium]|nr:hypothetical protein [Bacteroidales bacterium]
MIKYISHNEIDKQKWNACIDASGTGLIYAFSWYLDIVSPGWDALVSDDYSTIMPLTWSEKWGIRYLYPPWFTQQLGVFASNPEGLKQLDEFVDMLPKRYRFVEINLNGNNKLDAVTNGKVTMQTNHEIVLSGSFEELSKRFNRNCKRNISKAEASGIVVNEGITPETFVDFIRNNLEHQLKMLHSKDYQTLEILIKQVLARKQAEIYGAFDPNGEQYGVALFFITAQRCIFSVCASSEEGKKHQAMYMLVGHQVKKYAGSGKVFDFSGSNIPGIAYFNSTFGAEARFYPRIKINNLPWPLKIFKK